MASNAPENSREGQPEAQTSPPHPPRQPQQRGQQFRRPPQGQSSQRQPQQHQQGSIDLTVVIPLYNEEESLPELHKQLRTVLGRMNIRYELLFIDDGSTDRSFSVLHELRRVDRHIRAYRFRRNYGKSAALSVGFEKAQGAVVITMDADLQDDPNEIPSLKRKIEEGYDLVSGWKKIRRDPITKTVPSKLFNFVTSRMTGVKLHDFNCGLKAYRREVIKAVKVYGELHRFVPALAHWEGFRIGEMVVNHRPRRYGKTKFGIGRFWKGFLDLLTVLFTTRFFRRPLHLFGMIGLLTLFVGAVISIWLIVEKIMGLTSLGNRPLFLLGIMLVIVGVQFFSIGLLGEMVSKTQQRDEEYSIRDIIR
jgi:glycosyltransferase involved in cell wall biosynthesis